jgi:hypothetical protein
MKLLNVVRGILSVLAVVCFFGFGMKSFAEDTAKTKDQVQSKIEMHEKMAEMHKKAAVCLKAGKPEMECHKDMKEMMVQHKGEMKDMDCPMMGDMAKMHKHMHGKEKSEEHSEHHTQE